jgi:hypothetical protein
MTDLDGMGNVCDFCPTDATNACDPGDIDGDGDQNDDDNCPGLAKPDQADAIRMVFGDVCDYCPDDPTNTCIDALTDTDGDGVPDDWDNCPLVVNPTQADKDGDGIGNACDTCTDSDGDTYGDPGFVITGCVGSTTLFDNCTFKANPSQIDTDTDGMGNDCDTCPAGANNVDGDSDGIADACDYCPTDPTNTCTDALTDTDGDGVPDDWDNCPLVVNANQADYDGDGTGDACDTCTDSDRDGYGDTGFVITGCAGSTTLFDNCPFKASADQTDDDLDGMGNVCDFCPTDATNACDPGDIDGDTVQNDDDNCPGLENLDQADDDADGFGNVCDYCPDDPTNTCIDALTDTDGDGVPDDWDNCSLVVNANQADYDGDGTGDACDTCTDSDRDGYGDNGFVITSCAGSTTLFDNCPFKASADQTDDDLDGMGNVCDICPTDATNACDPGDIDGDNIQNDDDNCIANANNDQLDADGDGYGNVCDFCPSDPLNACIAAGELDTDMDNIPDDWDNCPFDINPTPSR